MNENLKGIMNDPKRRNIMLVLIVIVAFSMIAGVYFSRSNKASNKTAAPDVSVAGSGNSQNVPGSNPSPDYNRDVEKENARRAAEALKNGTSFDPRIVNNDALKGGSPIDSINKAQADKEKADREAAEAKAREAARLAAEEAARLAKLEADRLASIPPAVIVTPTPVQTTPIVVNPVAKAPGFAEQYALIAALSQSYKNKGVAIETDYTGNKGGNNSATTAAPTTGTNTASSAGTNTNTSMTAANDTVLLKAGDMLNAVLETSINSDEPSPVLVKVVTGPLKGARGVCTMQKNGEKTLVQCTKLSIPSAPKSITVSLVAVDPNTSRTGLATSVNNHYFERYVIGLGAAFLKGYADAITRQNTTTAITTGGSIVVSQGQLSSKDIVQSGLGEVGKTVAEDVKQNSANLKPTVYVMAGTAIGLLAMDDVIIK